MKRDPIEQIKSDAWESVFEDAHRRDSDPRPCKGQNSNICVGEGCYGMACVSGMGA